MIRYFVQLEYDGTNYFGFQKQKHTRNTIQNKINKALASIANHKVKTVCAGRTDSGVHALNQIIHFDTNSKRTINSWIKGTNTYLPGDIAVKGFYKVDKNLHARFDASSRTYKYFIKQSSEKIAVERNNCLWVKEKLNVELMNKACNYLLGEKDFSSFRASRCQSASAIRTVHQALFRQKGQYLVFEISANAFLLNMIRILVGTLIDVGKKEISIKAFQKIINSKKRSSAGKTVSPNGLYFYGPEYNTFKYIKNLSLIDELD